MNFKKHLGQPFFLQKYLTNNSNNKKKKNGSRGYLCLVNFKIGQGSVLPRSTLLTGTENIPYSIL